VDEVLEFGLGPQPARNLSDGVDRRLLEFEGKVYAADARLLQIFAGDRTHQEEPSEKDYRRGGHLLVSKGVLVVLEVPAPHCVHDVERVVV